MSRHNEHGPIQEPERAYGPEWWAMGAELCVCGHRLDEHVDPPVTGYERVCVCAHTQSAHSPTCCWCNCVGFREATACTVSWYDHATGKEWCQCASFTPELDKH